MLRKERECFKIKPHLIKICTFHSDSQGLKFVEITHKTNKYDTREHLDFLIPHKNPPSIVPVVQGRPRPPLSTRTVLAGPLGRDPQTGNGSQNTNIPRDVEVSVNKSEVILLH